MYTARITRNFRDVCTSSPKVLLLGVKDEDGNEFRDHCWVNLTDALEKYLPRTNRSKKLIGFDAKILKYQTYGPAKRTLTSIHHIKIIKSKDGHNKGIPSSTISL